MKITGQVLSSVHVLSDTQNGVSRKRDRPFARDRTSCRWGYAPIHAPDSRAILWAPLQCEDISNDPLFTHHQVSIQRPLDPSHRRKNSLNTTHLVRHGACVIAILDRPGADIGTLSIYLLLLGGLTLLITILLLLKDRRNINYIINYLMGEFKGFSLNRQSQPLRRSTSFAECWKTSVQKHRQSIRLRSRSFCLETRSCCASSRSSSC